MAAMIADYVVKRKIAQRGELFLMRRAVEVNFGG